MQWVFTLMGKWNSYGKVFMRKLELKAWLELSQKNARTVFQAGMQHMQNPRIKKEETSRD